MLAAITSGSHAAYRNEPFTFRDYAADHPSLKTSALGCRANAQYTCFGNPKNKIQRINGVTADSGDCCALCSKNPTCVSYNHAGVTGGFYCDLFSTVGATHTTHDGCTSGISAGPKPPVPPAPPRGDKPNIVFLVVESTDGRTWSPGYSNDVIPLPNIRELQSGGIEFRKHYANAPVCCPSRATFWSGRHASNLEHDHNGVPVPGALNNYEGLPQNFTDRIDQVLTRSSGYNIKVNGKTDWSTGGHTENVRLNAWTMVSLKVGLEDPFPHFISSVSSSETSASRISHQPPPKTPPPPYPSHPPPPPSVHSVPLRHQR